MIVFVDALPGSRDPGGRSTKRQSRIGGTTDKPGPTLNLVADPSATCTGIAFQFPEEQGLKVLDYLKRREGKGFDLNQQEIRLENG